MGKYMRKSKASGEVAVMEVGGALLGVRTRSRTLLAMQQRASSPSPSPQRKGNEDKEGDFLELRSRRLEKQPQPPPGHKEKDAATAGRKEQASAFTATVEEGFGANDLDASFGDNVLDWDAIERSTRETTPCSLIRSSETMSTPGSATRTNSRRMPTCRYVPSSLEMDEFFDAAERQQHQAFRENFTRYNFCPASECPLPGRYEWARIDC